MATSKEVKQAEKEGAAAKPETAAELQEKIRAQVEYYLSRKNLLQDSYLVGKMDKDHFVDVSVIAEFKLIKQLTTDVDLILASVKGSEQIVIDEVKKKIKPATLHQRTTLILRNVPSDAPTETVEKLLASVKVPKILSLKAEIGDNWFVTFETEDCTKTALELVKGLKWQEKRISAAIKSENALKGLTSGGATAIGVVAPYYVPMGVGSNGYIVSNGQYNYSYGNAGEGGHAGYRQGGRGGPGAGGRRGPGVGGAAANGSPADNADGARRAGAGKKKGRGVREGGREAGSENGRLPGSSLPSGTKEGPQASINLADFPILEAKGTKKEGDSSPKVSNSEGDSQKKENIAPSGGESNKAAPETNGTHNCESDNASPGSSSSAPKKPYAKMALAAAAAAAAAPAGPAAAQVPTAQGVSVSKSE
jgi:hypothetical protein